MRAGQTAPPIGTTGRRRAVALATLAGLGAWLAGAFLGGGSAPAGLASEPPNVVLIVTDDQDRRSFRGKVMPATRELVAEKGTIFKNAIVTTPQCCPSRASLITGQYAHNNRVWSNQLGYDALVEKNNVLPAWLQRAGYVTAHVGKYLNGYFAVEPTTKAGPGWDEWHTRISRSTYYNYDLAVNGKVVHYGDEDRDHVTRVLNRIAVRMVRRYAPGDEPLYLQLDHTAPHAVSNGGGSCTHAAVPDTNDLRRFATEPLPKPPSFDEDDVSDKPSFVRAHKRIRREGVKEITRIYRCALSSLRGVDRGVRRIQKTLLEAGELRNTVIIFTSDNGFYFGQHRIRRGKQFPYEEGLRVPLAIRLPKRYRDGKRVPRIHRPVANIDLAPTILKLADADPCIGVGNCRTVDGRGLVGLLRGGGKRWPPARALAIEYGLARPGTVEGRKIVCEYRGLRIPGYVYLQHTSASLNPERTCQPISERELYDLNDDRFQLDNLLVTDPGSVVDLEDQLSDRLNALRNCAGIAGRDPEPPGGHWCE